MCAGEDREILLPAGAAGPGKGWEHAREEAVSIEEPEALRKEGHMFQANQGYATSKAILSYVLRPFSKDLKI